MRHEATFDNAPLAARIVGFRQKSEPEQKPNPANLLPVILDLAAMAMGEPDPPGFIIPGWLSQGEVTLFSSHGGAGKSFIALHLAVCIAAGQPFFGLPVQRRRVAFLSCEDGASILHWRLSRICAWLGVDMTDLAGWLNLWDQSDGDGALATETREGLAFTRLFGWVQLQKSFDVLMLDGASDTFDGDEIKRRQVRLFIRSLRSIIPKEGAVLLLAHVNAATARNAETSQGFSGSTAWHNSCRGRWYLRTDGDALRLETQKGNHSGAGHSMRVRWNEAAHTFVGELEMPTSKLERTLAQADARQGIVDLVGRAEAAGDPIPASRSGSRSCHEVALAHGLSEQFQSKRGKATFYAEINGLLACGLLVERTLKRKYSRPLTVYSVCAETDQSAAKERKSAETEPESAETEQ